MHLRQLGLTITLAATMLPGTVAAQSSQPGLLEKMLFRGGFDALTFVVGLLLVLIPGALLVAVAPEYCREMERRVTEDTVQTAAFGLLFAPGIPIVLFVASFLVITIIVTGPALLLYLVLTIVAQGVAAIAIGTFVVRKAGDGIPVVSQIDDGELWAGLVIVALLASAVSTIPFVTFLLTWSLAVVGGGAMLSLFYQERWGNEQLTPMSSTGTSQGTREAGTDGGTTADVDRRTDNDRQSG